MTEITLSAVSKRFGKGADSAAVRDVDLTVRSGEFFTLLGPSGCGKTTTLRMIAGFYFPSEGRILFDGDDVTRRPVHRRGTGMVFQNYALFPHLSVAENVAYGLKVRHVDAAERRRRVERALDQVHLPGLGDRRIDQLSGGQQQRVALARALVIVPRVLLLDEPLSNLDAKLREETRREIRRIQLEAGLTALYVTHDQAEAMAVSDRIAVLEAGHVHQVGTPVEVYREPRTAFVARFIGNSNVFTGQVVGGSGDVADVRFGADGQTVTVRVPVPSHVDAGAGTVAVSIRPEHVRLASPQAPGSLPAVVTSVEFTGLTTNVEASCGGERVGISLVGGDTAPGAGDRVGLLLPPEHLRVVAA